MLRFQRPDRPEDFDEHTREARLRVEQAVDAGEKPDFEPPIWRDYKSNFAATQHRKCAYCETKTATDVGAVDHFRPKSAVSELEDDPTTWGREKPHLTNVEGRRPRPLSDRGYWWLAYEWSNLLFACERCNTAWKGSLFPLADPSRRASRPGQEVDEVPLLLDPYGDEDPANHLRFNDLGSVEPKDGSPMGFETIRTLGFDRRESLRDVRKEKARRASWLVKSLREAKAEAVDEIIDDILEMGKAEYAHAGMVRIILKQEADIDWAELEGSGPAASDSAE